MAALTETQVVALELEKTRKKVPVLFDRDDAFFTTIKRRPGEIISNRQMRMPLEIRTGGYTGHWNPAGGDLGRGKAQQWDKAVISVEHLRHAIEWETLADWSTNTDEKSVVNATRHAIAKATAEFRRNLDSLCMTGGDGVLATISAVATAGGKDTYTCKATGNGFQIRLLRFGQKINVYNAGLTTKRTATEVEIDLYDDSAEQVRVASAVTGAAATDKIVVEGLSATPPVSLLGVPYHHTNASSGTWLGLDRAANPEIRANRVNAAGSLSLTHARLARNKIGNRLGIAERRKTTAWMHPCQKQAYEELGQLVSVVNKSSKDEGLDLYFGDNMQMAGSAIREHYSWDKARIDFVVEEFWGRAIMKEIDWYEVEGRKIFEVRGASGGVAASQISYLVTSFNLYMLNPPGASYIDGLTIPAGYIN